MKHILNTICLVVGLEDNMQKTIGIYQCHICQIGGVETWLYNFCTQLRNYYDITILYSTGDMEQISRLAKLVKIE